MKSVVQNYKTGELAVLETPPPQLRPGWVLVRNSYSLISAGTEKTKVDTAQKSLFGKALARPDLVKKVLHKALTEGLWKTWQTVSERLETPTALGYSCAGEILEVGGDTDDLVPGDLVACGGSTANHAEIVCVPKNLVVRVPGVVRLDHAAFATLGAIAMQGVRQADARLGEKIAVIGLGLVGLLTVQIARASGCRVFGIDIDRHKLDLACALGCDSVALATDDNLVEKVLAFTGGYGFDATIIAAATSSNTPIEQAAEITRERGKVIAVGLTKMDVPREPFYLKELDLRLSRSYGPGRYDKKYEDSGHDYPYAYVRFTEQRNMSCFLELLENKQVQLDPIITHRFSIDDAAKAYDLLRGHEPYLGILLEYPVINTINTPLQRGESEACGRSDRSPLPRGEGEGEGQTGKSPLLNTTVAIQTPKSKIQNRPRRLGVIGAGKYATANLLPHLQKHPDIALGFVCTSSGMTAAHVARKFGFEAASGDPDEVIAQSDAVLIATRHNDHADYVLRALKAGKPVFVEKPLAINEDELARVVECFEAINTPLQQSSTDERRSAINTPLQRGESDAHYGQNRFNGLSASNTQLSPLNQPQGEGQTNTNSPATPTLPVATLNSQLSTLNQPQGEGQTGKPAPTDNQSPITDHRSLSIMVGFNRRFAPAIALVKDHFASIATPKQILIRINAGSIPADHWIHDPYVGGGRLIGEGCHFVDLAVALTGSLVGRVSATGTPKAGLPPASWDDFSIVLRMTDDSIATIVYTSTGDVGLAKERVEISGGGRSAVIDDFRAVELWTRGRRTRKRWWIQDKGQRAQVDAWISGLRQGHSPIPLEEIFNVHVACFGAIRSLRDRRTVIT